ncbi:hypothetical protein MACJ_002887 [Theileria orientalis]|uniref:FHA domain protein n=1 Tax=Theileria orientalis TaxID=68886 RepID=A0A976M6P4_THEOR|nr:hypothetical protein MACJ_002887 [Theileria orientalis]
MSIDKSGLVKYPSDLSVRWLTYSNDTAGLLDFEHKFFNRHYLNIRKGFYNADLFLVSDGPNCRILPGQEKTQSYLRINPRSQVLVKISQEDGKTFVSSPDRSIFENNNEVLRLISEKAFKKVFGHFKPLAGLPIALNEGDEIRLGRVKLVVRHLAYNSSLPLSYLHDLINEPADISGPQLITVATNATTNLDTDTVNGSLNSTPTNRGTVNSDSSVHDSEALTSGRSAQSKTKFMMPNDSSTDKTKGDPEKDDDGLTVCDLSTSRTSVTVENLIQITDNLDNTCRICLCNDDTNGPLITPCNCKGSLTYVHLSCIRSWIKGRLNCSTEGMPNKSYFWQKLTCELCGTVYPNKISIDNKEHDFVDIEQPQPPYLVLEPENMTDKGYFIVSLASNSAVIGRGHDSDIRLTDISVSRVHSVLYFDNNHFIIQDRRSKFGTLINTNKDSGFKVQLSPSNPVLLKIGNGLLSISVKKPFRPFFCFGSCPTQTTFSL